MRVLLALAIAALMAGCAEPEPAEDGGQGGQSSSTTTGPPSNGGGQGFAVQQGTAHGSNQGIDVDVTWRACEAGYCANATATNNGPATVKVSSICEPQWVERMADDDGDAVQHQAPQYMCLAYGRADFEPGDKAYGNFTWDGQLHDTDPPRAAPAGGYTWTLAFWWDDGDGGSRQEAAADVHVLVGVPT